MEGAQGSAAQTTHLPPPRRRATACDSATDQARQHLSPRGRDPGTAREWSWGRKAAWKPPSEPFQQGARPGRQRRVKAARKKRALPAGGPHANTPTLSPHHPFILRQKLGPQSSPHLGWMEEARKTRRESESEWWIDSCPCSNPQDSLHFLVGASSARSAHPSGAGEGPRGRNHPTSG